MKKKVNNHIRHCSFPIGCNRRIRFEGTANFDTDTAHLPVRTACNYTDLADQNMHKVADLRYFHIERN